ncbi:MAG: glycosyltransferase family 2 protein, partial [Planctomycetes bacterium]|nr:glycosyltransferase family 2 protein [Planctomycetota bacterium]
IPCFNEVTTIENIVEAVLDCSYEKKEIIIVDDFSTDGTREKLKSEIEPKVDKVIYHDRNWGKGAALRTGFKSVTGDIVVIQDADLEYDPADYPALLGPILEGRADVVFGTRFLGGEHRVLYHRHYLGNRIITAISNLFTNLNLTDVEAGYKVFRAGVLEGIEIESNRFGLEPELAAKIAKTKCRVYEVPIGYHGRTYAEGKKITWRDGIAAVWWILKYNLFR